LSATRGMTTMVKKGVKKGLVRLTTYRRAQTFAHRQCGRNLLFPAVGVNGFGLDTTLNDKPFCSAKAMSSDVPSCANLTTRAAPNVPRWLVPSEASFCDVFRMSQTDTRLSFGQRRSVACPSEESQIRRNLP
jgi:hypothetical protein